MQQTQTRKICVTQEPQTAYKTMKNLIDKHVSYYKRTPMNIIRQCSKDINWDNPLIAIQGPKGVGKSTMMRQYIKQHYAPSDRSVLYCSCDGAYFASHTLLDLAEQFYKLGGKHLFLDEIHKYPNWSREIKEIYDLYESEMRIVISGSSLLSIQQGDSDLSRRCVKYDIQGLSFREFLYFYKGIDLPKCTLEELLENPWPIAEQVHEKCRPLQYFLEYLQYGYYPYHLRIKAAVDYYSTIESTVSYIIDDELPRICKVDVSNTRKIKALVNILAVSVPYDVDIKRLSIQSALQRATILEYLNDLDKAKIVHLLYSDYYNAKKMQKPDKILMDNSNMLYALASQPVNIGTVRETFAVNQLSQAHLVEYGKSKGDFLVAGKYTFEVGGADKDYTQIADVPNSYILADDMEYPYGHKLPLWMVGFLY